jgi:hypothetical protein
MLRGQGPHTIKGEGPPRRYGLLYPERAIVIERGNSLIARNESRAALRGDIRDKVQYRLFAGPFVPRGERIGAIER